MHGPSPRPRKVPTLLYSGAMRASFFLVGTLLVLLVTLPALRQASTPSGASKEPGITHAPRSAPAIARTAALTGVAVQTPPLIAVDAVLPRPEPRTPATPRVLPVVQLRL